MDQRCSQPEDQGQEYLGGRLPLLNPTGLDAEQRGLYAILEHAQIARAKATGYVAALDDGRLVGPFNAMLRHPQLAHGLGDWVSTITKSSKEYLSPSAREVVILTVGVHWKADYVIYAHSASAYQAGVSDANLQAILQGHEPGQLSREAFLARSLALRFIKQERVEPALYSDLLQQFGEKGILTLIALIAQYIHTSCVLTCFEIPVPYERRTG